MQWNKCALWSLPPTTTATTASTVAVFATCCGSALTVTLGAPASVYLLSGALSGSARKAELAFCVSSH